MSIFLTFFIFLFRSAVFWFSRQQFARIHLPIGIQITEDLVERVYSNGSFFGF